MEEKKIRAQDKWDAKAGIVQKTYKIDKDTAEKFKETCNRLNLGQGPVLTKLMRDSLNKIDKTKTTI